MKRKVYKSDMIAHSQHDGGGCHFTSFHKNIWKCILHIQLVKPVLAVGLRIKGLHIVIVYKDSVGSNGILVQNKESI